MGRINGKLRVGVIVILTGVVATGVLMWATGLDGQVEINRSDIKETKTVVRMMREEQRAGFTHLEEVIREGR